MKKVWYLLCFVAVFSVTNKASSQGFLKKLKDKVSNAVNNQIDQKAGVPASNGTSSNDNNTNTTSSGKPTNKGGGGLSNTAPPDVNAQITDAITAHAAKNYSDSRYSLQQALIGVEIQLGHQIIKSLPTSLDGLNVDTAQDIVTSTQWGWSNLTIHRVWKNGADKQLTITIGNAGMYASIATMYFSNASMIEANGGKQNFKQVRVKGNKALIQYEDRTGYTLIVSIGQTSMIVYECINFANEQEVMNTANSIDIDGIKKLLGEQ